MKKFILLEVGAVNLDLVTCFEYFKFADNKVFQIKIYFVGDSNPLIISSDADINTVLKMLEQYRT